ncbi:efflux RND transporter permease subunit [Candidatus Sumerlaeota bacterium]|nr:efflux RND transporter permease subunit [Candidatus Sumerlaeota bacterium]
MKLTHYAVHRRLATSAILLAFVVLGLYGLWRLPVDFLPNITYPMIRVQVWWRGATPEEIDKSIADPIERRMATVDDLDYLESSSIEGMYTLQVNFKYGVDVNAAYQDALAAMARVARELPADMDPPIVIKADPSQLPVVQLTVSSGRWDLVELRTWVDEWLQDQLLAVSGVAGTEIVGGLKREIRVHLDPNALEKFGIGLADVLKRLREENIEQFGGRVTVGPKEIIARTMGEYRSLDEIRNVLLTRDGHAKVYVRDVAEALDSHEEARVITRLNGNPCVKLSVLKQADANTVEVANAVNRRIAELGPALPEDIALGMVENQADYVNAALSGVRNAAVEAAILVILIVWLFLGSWRQVLAIALALPLTLVLNFGLMKLAGFSLNIFSLGGLVIAIGVLVDNSIVVIETITRRRHDLPGAPADAVAIDATSEIGPAIVAATLSFLALFVPFLLVPGLVSLLFRELILVIAGIVVISLVMAVTVTPTITALVLGKHAAARKVSRFERFFEGVTEAYGWTLGKALRARWIVIAAFVSVLVLAALAMGRLGSEFLPQMDDGRIMVKVKLPTGASLAETDKLLERIEKEIGEDERIESLFALSGGRVAGLYTYEIANEGELNIQLVPRSRRRMSTDEYIDCLRPIVGKVPVPGGNAMVMQMKLKGIRKLGEADIEVKIRGQDIGRLHELARQTAGAMNQQEHFTNVYVSMDMTKPEYQVWVDRARAAELGVAIGDVADTMRSLIAGAVATRFRDGDEYYNIRVMIPESKMVARRDVENLPLQRAQGGYLRLKDVAEVRQAVGPVEIVREDQVKEAIVRGDAAGVSVGQALGELKASMEKMDRPIGYDFSFGGQAHMMTEMKQTVLAILAFAIFFSFIVLTVQFNSLRLPALILGSVPFCMAGLVFIMLASGLPLGATVIIGVLVIVAATVNDGVLLLTFANELRERKGLSSFDAVLQAARIRLRPRVMTTVSVLVGFIPLALAIEEGGDMLQPMAVAAIGGLLMEMPVALFLMPCLYVMASRKADPREV